MTITKHSYTKLTHEQREDLKRRVSAVRKPLARKQERLERASENGVIEVLERRVIDMGFTCMWEGCDEPVNSYRGMACYCTVLQENGKTHRQMSLAKRDKPRSAPAPAPAPPPQTPNPSPQPDVDDDTIVGEQETVWDKIAATAKDIKHAESLVDDALKHLQECEAAVQRLSDDLRELIQETRL